MPGRNVSHYGYLLYAIEGEGDLYVESSSWNIKNNGTTVLFEAVISPKDEPNLIRHYGFRVRLSTDSEGDVLVEPDTNWIPTEVPCQQ